MNQRNQLRRIKGNVLENTEGGRMKITDGFSFSAELELACVLNKQLTLYVGITEKYLDLGLGAKSKKAYIDGADLAKWLPHFQKDYISRSKIVYQRRTAYGKAEQAMTEAKMFYCIRKLEKTNEDMSKVRPNLWKQFKTRVEPKITQKSFDRNLRRALDPGQLLIAVSGDDLRTRMIFGYWGKLDSIRIWTWSDHGTTDKGDIKPLYVNMSGL